jgi:hypothetical protein
MQFKKPRFPDEIENCLLYTEHMIEVLFHLEVGGIYNWMKIYDVKIKTSGTPTAV